MRAIGWVVAGCLVALVASGLRGEALQSTVTDTEYDAAMKEIRLTVGDADLHLQSQYWPELGTDTDRLKTFFEQVEAFWSAKGTEQATVFAGEALAAVATLSSAVGQQDRQAATNAINTLRDVCQSCHGVFREQTEDGYRIKPGA